MASRIFSTWQVGEQAECVGHVVVKNDTIKYQQTISYFLPVTQALFHSNYTDIVLESSVERRADYIDPLKVKSFG